MRARSTSKDGRGQYPAPSILVSRSSTPDQTISAYLVRIWPAYADRTIDGLRSDWHLFSSWCRARQLSALPARPGTVADYLEEIARDEVLADPAEPCHSPAHAPVKRLIRMGKLAQTESRSPNQPFRQSDGQRAVEE